MPSEYWRTRAASCSPAVAGVLSRAYFHWTKGTGTLRSTSAVRARQKPHSMSKAVYLYLDEIQAKSRLGEP